MCKIALQIPISCLFWCASVFDQLDPAHGHLPSEYPSNNSKQAGFTAIRFGPMSNAVHQCNLCHHHQGLNMCTLGSRACQEYSISTAQKYFSIETHSPHAQAVGTTITYIEMTSSASQQHSKALLASMLLRIQMCCKQLWNKYFPKPNAIPQTSSETWKEVGGERHNIPSRTILTPYSWAPALQGCCRYLDMWLFSLLS